MKFVFKEWYNRSVKSGCVESDFTPQVCFNAGVLLERLNSLGFVPARVFSSCLRSTDAQIRIYKQKGITDKKKIPLGSCHLSGEAVDIADPDGSLQKWLKENTMLLEGLGLYVEDFKYTPGWVHIQTRAPKSGRRFFIP